MINNLCQAPGDAYQPGYPSRCPNKPEIPHSPEPLIDPPEQEDQDDIDNGVEQWVYSHQPGDVWVKLQTAKGEVDESGDLIEG